MNTLAFAVFAALYTHSVQCSYYNGPTAKPLVLHNGYLADIHEVAAAKNAHLATLGQQQSYGADYGYEGEHGDEHKGSHGDIRYHGPTAKLLVLHNGYLADTHEVAAAKNAHLATLGQQQSYGADYGYEGEHGNEHRRHGDIRYHGPTAIPHVLHDGHIADTHEVAAAKAEHFATVAKAKAHGGYGDHYSGGYASGYGADHGHFHHVAPSHGPLAIPHVLHDGHIADTHEVAAAKAEHFATVAKVKAHGGYGDHYSGGYASGYGADHGHFHHVAPSHGPTAIPHVLHDGHIADTHEVAAAKAEHFATVAKAKAHGGYGDHYIGGYASGYGADHGHFHHVAPSHGPLAIPHVLHDGHIADTHEVAAAKAEHFATVAKAKAHGGYGDHYSGGYASGYGADHGHFHHVAPYHGPLAIPHVLHDGHIADTHEVADAKAEHFATVAKAKAHGGYGDHYSGGHASGYGADHGHFHHVAPYHGPLAIPHVLHYGHIADTHEVAAAKAEHFATVAKAKAHGGYGDHYSGGYASGYGADHGHSHHHGPTAIPHVLHDGHIADTHKVAAAKAEHFATVAKAKAHGGYGDHYCGGYASGYGVDHGHFHHVAPYHGPLAKPVVLKSGYLADTHEVAAAKKHHLNLLHTGPQYGIY